MIRVPRSNTVKAGGLLIFLGSVLLTLGLFGAGDILVRGYPSRDFVWELPAVVAIAGLYFVIGAGLIEYRPWARVLGVIISLISLAGFWLGVIGVLALYYLVTGWREHPVSNRVIANRTAVSSLRKRVFLVLYVLIALPIIAAIVDGILTRL
jgi:hypothetical protein